MRSIDLPRNKGNLTRNKGNLQFPLINNDLRKIHPFKNIGREVNEALREIASQPTEPQAFTIQTSQFSIQTHGLQNKRTSPRIHD